MQEDHATPSLEPWSPSCPSVTIQYYPALLIWLLHWALRKNTASISGSETIETQLDPQLGAGISSRYHMDIVQPSAALVHGMLSL